MHMTHDTTLLQEAYFHQTPEEQKKFMQSKIAGWTVGMPSPFVDVVAANKPEDIKLSKIYQRCSTVHGQ